MGEPEDTTRRLDLLDVAYKEEIEYKKAEIENKQQELHEKQHVSGITKQLESQYNQEIAKLKKELEDLSNNGMSKLTSAIYKAFNVINEWTPGLVAAITVAEKYHEYLKQAEEANTIVTQCSESLNLLATDIKNCSVDKGGSSRIVSALKGLGLVLAGVGLAILAVPTTLGAGVAGGGRMARELLITTKNTFVKAFESFKETWTGKREPPELKDLSQALNALKIQYSLITKTPYSFYTAAESSKEDTPELTQALPPKL